MSYGHQYLLVENKFDFTIKYAPVNGQYSNSEKKSK